MHLLSVLALRFRDPLRILSHRDDPPLPRPPG